MHFAIDWIWFDWINWKSFEVYTSNWNWLGGSNVNIQFDGDSIEGIIY